VLAEFMRAFEIAGIRGSLGLSCTTKGVFLAGVPLLRRTKDGLRSRPDRELDCLFVTAYDAIDPSIFRACIRGAAYALEAGDVRLARGLLALAALPELDWDGAVRVLRVDNGLQKYNYNPEEPRDWHGRWTTTGDGRPSSTSSNDAPTRRSTWTFSRFGLPRQANPLLTQMGTLDAADPNARNNRTDQGRISGQANPAASNVEGHQHPQHYALRDCHEECVDKCIGRGLGSQTPFCYWKCMRECEGRA
jgi:hypothetical protein